jgi:hypothetical protein
MTSSVLRLNETMHNEQIRNNNKFNEVLLLSLLFFQFDLTTTKSTLTFVAFMMIFNVTKRLFA